MTKHNYQLDFPWVVILVALLGAWGCSEPVDTYTAQEVAFVPGQIEGEAKSLFTAVDRGDFDSVVLAIETGIDVNAQDDRGATALHIAVFRGEVEIAEYLISRGADLDRVNADGLTALNTAEYVRHGLLVTIIGRAMGTDSGVIPDTTSTLWEAAKIGDLTAIQFHLSDDIDINAPFDLPGDTMHGASALHLAVMEFNNQAASFLIEQGADVNVRVHNETAATPLHWAVEAANVEGVKLLLQAGADVGIKDATGVAPLGYLERAPKEAETEVMEIKALLTTMDSEQQAPTSTSD